MVVAKAVSVYNKQEHANRNRTNLGSITFAQMVLDRPHVEVDICCVCLETTKLEVLLEPCGHTVCKTCAPQLDKCPKCRGQFTTGATTPDAKYGWRAVEMALHNVKPYLVGPEGSVSRMEAIMLQTEYFQLRADHIYNFIQIFKHVPPTPDPRFADAPDYAWFVAQLADAHDRIKAYVQREALRCEDVRLDVVNEGSDVAGIRSHAQGNVDAAADAPAPPESGTAPDVPNQSPGAGWANKTCCAAADCDHDSPGTSPGADPEPEAGAAAETTGEARPEDEGIFPTHRGATPARTTTMPALLQGISKLVADIAEVENPERAKQFREEIRRCDLPMSDYRDGAAKIMDVWPDYFPRREGFGGADDRKGTVRKRSYERMSMYQDARFAQDAQWVFVNAHVRSVLDVNTEIGLRCASASFEKLKATVTSESFFKDLVAAHTDSKKAHDITAKILGFTRFVAKNISHSAAQKGALVTAFLAEMRNAGPAAIFDTNSYDDAYDPLAVRLGLLNDGFSEAQIEDAMKRLRSDTYEEQKGSSDLPWRLRMDKYALQERAANSPMVATLAFQQFRENLQENLVGLTKFQADVPLRERPKGVHGRCASWRDVLEAVAAGVNLSSTRVGDRPGILPRLL